MAPHIESGAITATLSQQPYRPGQLAVRVAARHLVQRLPLEPRYTLHPIVVLRSNLEQFELD
jgi:ABC-type sugar transport system substrate-binding protein